MGARKKKPPRRAVMKGGRLLWEIIKLNHLQYYLFVYLLAILVVSLILQLVEPGIASFGDAVWYCFALITTIGLGDITAVTLVGRLLSMVLGICSLFVVAITTAMVINFYQEKLRMRQNESVLLFLDKIEHLPELSREELEELSERIQKLKR